MALTLAQMNALFNDNTAGDISAADGRSVIEALFYHSRFAADLAADPPDAMDDEFGDVKWTAQHLGTTPTWTIGADGRWYLTKESTSAGWATQLQAIPAGDFDIRCKVAALTSRSADFAKPCGLLVAEGTTSQAITAVLVARRATTATSVARWTGSNWSTFSSETALGVEVYAPIYFRVTRATATYTWQWSHDGTNWLTVHSATLAYTPTVIGIGGFPDGGGPIATCFEWFRRFA